MLVSHWNSKQRKDSLCIFVLTESRTLFLISTVHMPMRETLSLVYQCVYGCCSVLKLLIHRPWLWAFIWINRKVSVMCLCWGSQSNQVGDSFVLNITNEAKEQRHQRKTTSEIITEINGKKETFKRIHTKCIYVVFAFEYYMSGKFSVDMLEIHKNTREVERTNDIEKCMHALKNKIGNYIMHSH